MEYGMLPIGEILKRERNIILKGADAATRGGFTQVPNFLLKSKTLSAGDKLAFAMLLSYAWQNDHCFPGQKKLADDMGLGRPLKVPGRLLPEPKRCGLNGRRWFKLTLRGSGLWA
jgi:hypothetical protein